MKGSEIGCITLLGLIGSLVTIFVFVTGRPSLPSLWKAGSDQSKPSSMAPNSDGTTPQSWEDGVPPAPPDIRGDVPIIELGEQEASLRDSACSYFERKIVAIISEDKSGSLPSYEMAGTDSIRNNYYVEDASEADSSWLMTIMVPGRRLKVSYTVCGNGGIHSLKRIEVIPSR
jgi:hypothetical protein